MSSFATLRTTYRSISNFGIRILPMVKDDKLDKVKLLESAVKEIQDKYGEGSIMKLGEAKRVDVDAIPTGSFSLDADSTNFILQVHTSPLCLFFQTCPPPKTQEYLDRLPAQTGHQNFRIDQL